MKIKVFVPLLVVLLVATIGLAAASPETFTVSAGQEVVRGVALEEGDKVSGSINVSGGAGDDIDFYVTDPNGNTILRYDRTTQTSFSFRASIAGTHTLHFDNSFSTLSSKSVTLDYRVTKYLLSLVPELFYLLVILAVVVVAAIIVAFALRRREPATLPQ